MWQIIHDWSDVCRSCWLGEYWKGEVILLLFLSYFVFMVFKARQVSIKKGEKSDFYLRVPIKFTHKRLLIKIHILLPFFMLGGYWIFNSAVYTYQVMNDTYVDHEYNRLQHRIQEGPVYCIQGQHADSYVVDSGKKYGDHYVKFDTGEEFYRGLYDSNRLCFSGGQFFYREFYDAKERLGTDQVEFKMCWVVDVDDKRSLSKAGGGKCIFELKYRAIE